MKKIVYFKFRTQLYIYFVIVISLVILCMWGVLYFILGNSYKEKENQVLSNQVKQLALNVDNRLDYYQSYMKLILSNKILSEYLKENNYSEIQEYVKELTSEFVQLNSGKISEINLYKKGYYDIESKKEKMKALLEVQKQVGMENRDFYYTGTYLNDRNEKVFSVFRKIYQGNSERNYFLEFCIYESELYGFFNEDKSGNQIYVVNGEKLMSVSDRPWFLKQLQGAAQKKQFGVPFTELTEKIPVFVTGKNGWRIIIYTDMQYLNRGLSEVWQKMFPIILLILVCVFLLVVYISNQLNYRMGILQKKILGIGSEEYEENEENLISGADEFKWLGDEIDQTRLHIKQLIEEIDETNKSQRVAEMIALRAQINSHFLFNALASLKWMARSGDDQVVLSEAIDKLAVFLRYSISTEEHHVLLEREVEQLEAYIYLQKLRCGDDLNVVVDIEEELSKCSTVKLILQPLVENAVFHGRKDDGGALNITIYSYYNEEYYFLVVEDDGNGMTKERIQTVLAGNVEAANGGYGLRNVMNRVDICTGGAGNLMIESEPDKYTKIVICQKR